MELNIVSRGSSKEKKRNAHGKCRGRHGRELRPHQRVVRAWGTLMLCG